MINKYEFKHDGSTPFLVYGEGKLPHEDLMISLLEENIDLLSRPDEQIYPIMSLDDLAIRIFSQKAVRTRDKVLAENNIESFYDLQCAYNLVRSKKLQSSKKVRDYVVEKYSEIINLEYNPNEHISENDENISSENLEE